jgi:RNA polymerase sigma-70 factor (ECF subfamily)
MKLRKRRSIREVSMEDNFEIAEHASPFAIADWAPNPEQQCGAIELRNILRNQLQELQPNLRVAFVLRDIEGLSTEEAAEVLQLTADTVKARLWRRG